MSILPNPQEQEAYLLLARQFDIERAAWKRWTEEAEAKMAVLQVFTADLSALSISDADTVDRAQADVDARSEGSGTTAQLDAAMEEMNDV